MLIPHPHPHPHFCGDCAGAISLYEKAFNTRAEHITLNNDYVPNEGWGDARIDHAVMTIHGQKVFLNDRFDKKSKSFDTATSLIITFNSTHELLECYEIMKQGSTLIDPLQELPYSKLTVQFIDRFGLQ